MNDRDGDKNLATPFLSHSSAERRTRVRLRPLGRAVISRTRTMRLRSLLLTMIGLALAVIVVNRWQTDALYRAKLVGQLADDAAAPEGAVVFLGDSIIERLDTGAIAPAALNFGIAGDASRDLLERLPRYSSLAKARAIFLEIGINDLVRVTGEDIVANYRRILAAIPKEPRLYVIGILPIDERAYRAAYGDSASNTEIVRLNTALRELCRQRGNCVSLQPFGAESLLPEYHSGDGLHLSPAGYGTLTAAIEAALA